MELKFLGKGALKNWVGNRTLLAEEAARVATPTPTPTPNVTVMLVQGVLPMAA